MAQRKPVKRPRRKGPLRSPTRPPRAAGGRRGAAASGEKGAPERGRTRAAQRAPEELSQKLHKVLAQAGLGSRRAMEEWIKGGKVTVNNAVATIGARVTPTDVIRVEGKIVRSAAATRLPRVLIYHKPEGEIVSQNDPEGRATVFERLPAVRGAKWLAIGRLDYNTSGLLVFTTSGELANRMMHPRFEIEREYAVRIVGTLNSAQLERLKKGIELTDGVARCVSVEDEGGEGTNHWYRLVLKEGRNRVVRRMFEALGLTVSRLMRVRFGPLSLPPRLKRGQVSALPAPEVKRLLSWLEQTAPQSKAPEPATHA